MTLKEELKQFHDILQEIPELKSKIEKLEKRKTISDIVTGSSRYFPYGESHFKIDGIIPEIQDELNSYMLLLRSKYKDLIIQQIKIEQVFRGMPTSRLRRIFELRYIDNCSWVKVAHRIGGNVTANSIRMEHDRFLKEQKKEA